MALTIDAELGGPSGVGEFSSAGADDFPGRARASWRARYARKLVIADSLVIVAAVVVAYWLRFSVLPTPLWTGLDYSVVSVVIIVVWLVAQAAFRTRSPRIIGEGADEYRRVVTSTLAVFGGVAIASMLFKLDIARGYLAIALPLGITGLILGRVFIRWAIVAARRHRGACITSVIAVGDVRAVRGVVQYLAGSDESGYRVVGACITGGHRKDALEVPRAGRIPVYGNETSVVDAVRRSGAGAVALTATEHLGRVDIRDLSWDLEKLDVDLLISPGMADIAGPRLVMRPGTGLPLIYVEKPQYSGTQRIAKRVFDVVFSLLVLILTAPLLLLVALAIKLTSKGPVFYLSERIGLDGLPFQMIKFRTMVVDADERLDALLAFNDNPTGVLFKMRDDPRVTAVGRLLRKFSIDEIPQFINVVRRDMSVVGPRPPLPREARSYDSNAKRRLLVRPGITGLWQVSGRSDLNWEESVRLDLFYVENWSMTADFVIVMKTFRAVAGHTGAY